MSEELIADVLTDNLHKMSVAGRYVETVKTQIIFWGGGGKTLRGSRIAESMEAIVTKYGDDVMGYWKTNSDVSEGSTVLIHRKYYKVVEEYIFGTPYNNYLVLEPYTIWRKRNESRKL